MKAAQVCHSHAPRHTHTPCHTHTPARTPCNSHKRVNMLVNVMVNLLASCVRAVCRERSVIRRNDGHVNVTLLENRSVRASTNGISLVSACCNNIFDVLYDRYDQKGSVNDEQWKGEVVVQHPWVAYIRNAGCRPRL